MVKSKRILLKISGEGLSVDGRSICVDKLNAFALKIKSLLENGYSIALVIGGGNIFRGIKSDASFIKRTTADNMGMLATVFNGLALSDALFSLGVDNRVMSAIEMNKICEFYSVNKAEKYLNNNIVVIFVAGTSNPFCSTDSAAVLRAIEVKCDLLLKGTQVNGVYDLDPNKFENAKKYDVISYDEIIRNDLKIMDISSIVMAKNFNLNIIIFNMHLEKSIYETINDSKSYTLIKNL